MAIWVITRWYNLKHCRWPGHPRTAQSGLRPGRHGKIEPQGGYIPTCSYLVILIGFRDMSNTMFFFMIKVVKKQLWHSKGRFCSCLGYRTGSSVLTHTPTGWWNLDGGLHNCQLTTAACNSRGESKNLFYCWHAAVPNTMRLVWTSYSVHPRSFTYAVPSGMPIFDSELVVELWEGFHFKLKGLESFGQRVTNWDLRHSETMHFSGSMMINDG